MGRMGDSSDNRTAATRELTRAAILAGVAHQGQVDKAGAPYIEHVQRVAADVEGDEAKTVAFLHDVCEDTPVPLFELAGFGFSAPIVEAVDLLTRREPYNYIDYINRLTSSGNRTALIVKRADLRDHLNTNCPPTLRVRYEVALAEVESALADPAVALPHASASSVVALNLSSSSALLSSGHALLARIDRLLQIDFGTRARDEGVYDVLIAARAVLQQSGHALRPLIEQWRKGADQARQSLAVNRMTGNDLPTEPRVILEEASRVLRECADELEAALSALTQGHEPKK